MVDLTPNPKGVSFLWCTRNARPKKESRWFHGEEAEIEADGEAITKNREETVALRREIDDLRGGAQVFQQTRCTECGMQLSLPAVHFLCGHSFHENCLNVAEEGEEDTQEEDEWSEEAGSEEHAEVTAMPNQNLDKMD